MKSVNSKYSENKAIFCKNHYTPLRGEIMVFVLLLLPLLLLLLLLLGVVAFEARVSTTTSCRFSPEVEGPGLLSMATSETEDIKLTSLNKNLMTQSDIKSYAHTHTPKKILVNTH